MLRIIHPVAGALAIPWVFLLIPALALTGGSGYALAKGRRAVLIRAKMKRMSPIAANGILVPLACAASLASQGERTSFQDQGAAVRQPAILVLVRSGHSVGIP